MVIFKFFRDGYWFGWGFCDKCWSLGTLLLNACSSGYNWCAACDLIHGSDEYVPTDPILAAGSRALTEAIGSPIRNASQLSDDALGENPADGVCAECRQPLELCRCPLP